MTEETRQQVALFRFKLLSPVLAEPARLQNDYFRKQSTLEQNVPHYGPKKIAVSTFKRWLKIYRHHGFDALKPKSRADRGRPRRLRGDAWKVVCLKCNAFPHYTVKKLYEELLKNDQLGDPPLTYNSLVRLVRAEGLLSKSARKDIRKRYEADEVNRLWVCDFMHGPHVKVDGKMRKAILCAIIDDHSRLIVGCAFNAMETVSVLTVVLKEAFLAYGVPKRFYVDNGSAFSSDLLTKACAQAGISLIHSKPYDSPSRGKIERFFRTVRQRFLSGVSNDLTIDELNQTFALWLNEDYHHRLHRGIDEKPIERYQASAGRVDIRRLSKSELDEIFLIHHERVVNNDATISFRGRIYEVPSAYIRQRIEIRHTVDDDSQLFLYDQGVQIAALKLVDVKENARVFRPSQSDRTISFAQNKVLS